MLLTEGLVAVLKGTLVGLCPVVDMKVCMKADLTGEGLATAKLGTNEELWLLHRVLRLVAIVLVFVLILVFYRTFLACLKNFVVLFPIRFQHYKFGVIIVLASTFRDDGDCV